MEDEEEDEEKRSLRMREDRTAGRSTLQVAVLLQMPSPPPPPPPSPSHTVMTEARMTSVSGVSWLLGLSRYHGLESTHLHIKGLHHPSYTACVLVSLFVLLWRFAMGFFCTIDWNNTMGHWQMQN
jgi:hypothetical protein